MFAVHPLFQAFIILIIVLNTFILALDKYPEQEAAFQYVLN